MQLLLAGLTGWYVFDLIQSQAWTMNLTLSMIAVGLVVFALSLVWGYISILLEHFVMPIMYRDRITTTAAWKKFLPLYRRAFWRFILFGLWMLLLGIAIVVVIVVLGFATCCVGWIIMALPYVGTMLLLPVFVFSRLIGPDYLRQFGDEFDALTVKTPELPQTMAGSGDGAV